MRVAARIAEITEVHRAAFGDKRFLFLHELVDGQVAAQHARFELRHS